MYSAWGGKLFVYYSCEITLLQLFMLRTKMITLQFGKMYQGYTLVTYVTSFDLTHKL